MDDERHKAFEEFLSDNGFSRSVPEERTHCHNMGVAWEAAIAWHSEYLVGLANSREATHDFNALTGAEIKAGKIIE